MTSKRVLVLSSAESAQNRSLNDEFVAGINQQFGGEMQVEWAHYTDIGFHFNDGNIEAFWTVNGESLPKYDLAYFKSYYRYVENALSLVEYFKQVGTKFVCSELENGVSFSKLSQYARLSNENLPIPPTVFIPRPVLDNQFDTLVSRLGLPFVMKATDAKGGAANFLIHDSTEYAQALGKYPDLEFVAQSYIPNDGDLRIIVLDHNIELVIRRQRNDNSTHLNNTSQGGQATLIDPSTLDPEVIAYVVQAAKRLAREVAGVDLMFASNSGKPYILEVNASPQVASGAFPTEKVEKYGNFLNNMLK